MEWVKVKPTLDGIFYFWSDKRVGGSVGRYVPQHTAPLKPCTDRFRKGRLG